MNTSISFSTGKGSTNHNSRKFNAKNTDPNRTPLNIVYADEKIENVYHELFDEALNNYNQKQKRNDRKIDNYYEKICSSKQEKPFFEIIVQVGKKETTGYETNNYRVAEKILDEYMKGFKERNPYLRVFAAYLHKDEATPHLHIDFIPFTTGSKRGLDTRVSLKSALAQQGIIGSGKNDNEWNLWVTLEKEAIAKIMERYGLHWQYQGKEGKHLSVTEFKLQEKEKELKERISDIAALEQLVDDDKKHLEEIENINSEIEVEDKYKLPEATAFMSASKYKEKVEPLFKKLLAQLKATIRKMLSLERDITFSERRESHLQNENNNLKKLNDKLYRENAKMKKELEPIKFIKKVLGEKSLEELFEKAKETNRQIKKQRNKEFER